MYSLWVCVLDPLEALPQGPFHLPLHSIHFIPSNPLLPLQLWVTETPTFCWFPRIALHFLDVHLLPFPHFRWACIVNTIASQILHASWGFLQALISAWLGSEFHGGKIGNWWNGVVWVFGFCKWVLKGLVYNCLCFSKFAAFNSEVFWTGSSWRWRWRSSLYFGVILFNGECVGQWQFIQLCFTERNFMRLLGLTRYFHTWKY